MSDSFYFKVNDSITLKLEGEDVNIYVNGELFNQCKAILVNRQFSVLHDLNSIESVDELAETFEHSDTNMEDGSLQIPLETLFWAHCSNIQSWVEHDYDTRLLHSNLSFPLLKKLADHGDLRARQRFSEEVLKRFNEGSDNTKGYIIFQDYLKYIEDENKYLSILNEEDALLLIELARKYQIEFKVETFIPQGPRFHDSYIMIKDKKLTSMGLRINDTRAKVPSEISLFKNLSRLVIYLDNTDFIPPNVKFSNIKGLSIVITPRGGKDKYLIKNLRSFPYLRALDIVNDVIYQRKYLFNSKKRMSIAKIGKLTPKVEVSDDVGRLSRLESFGIEYCSLKKLPEPICDLKMLKYLSVKGCSLNRLLENLLGLNTLEAVSFEGTELEYLPLSLLKNQSLKFFSCEPYLITPEIKKWIKKRELDPFGEKAYRKMLYFEPAM